MLKYLSISISLKIIIIRGLIMIKIKHNDYTRPTECREEVVQMICDCFLQEYNVSDNLYHGSNHELPIESKVYVGKYKTKSNGQVDYTFLGEYDNKQYIDKDSIVRIRTCELDAAIKELNKAGYLLYCYLYRQTYRIRCSKKSLAPEIYKGFTSICEFNINID